MSFLSRIFRQKSREEREHARAKTLFEQQIAYIYPWIKVILPATDESPIIELSEQDSPIMESWLGDLIICYVIDKGDNFQLLLQQDMPADVSKTELHQIAIDNLTSTTDYTIYDTEFGFHGLVAGGDHEAAALCLPEIWKWLTTQYNDSLVVAVPAKDLLFFAAASDLDKIENLKRYVEEVFRTGDRLLTKNIFKVDRETLTWTIVDSVV